VLDDGFVRVVDYMGGDESIVQAARVLRKGTKKYRKTGTDPVSYAEFTYDSFEMCEIKLPRARSDGCLAPMDTAPHGECK